MKESSDLNYFNLIEVGLFPCEGVNWPVELGKLTDLPKK